MDYLRRLCVFAVFVFAALLLGSPFFSGSQDVKLGRESGVPAKCGEPFKALKRNVWAELTKADADAVYNFLVEEWADMNVTRTPKSGFENFIYTIEALRPNKTDVLPYMLADEAAPSQWAKVVLSRYVDKQAMLVYYAVGPLPVSAETKVMPLEWPFNSGRNFVTNMMVDFIGGIEFGKYLMANISDITLELLGTNPDKAKASDSDIVTSMGRLEKAEGDKLVIWGQFFRAGTGSAGRTLLPQGLYFKIYASGPAETWTVTNWFYNGVLYEDVAELRAAVQSPGFLKTPANLDGPWTDTEDFDAAPAGRERPPPVSVQPYGPRYRVDREQQFVSWFGFEFYFASSPAQGVGLFDVRFKGERVMYELSLQEALAHYAGDDPMAGGQMFLDAFFGMGSNMFELVPGYDCPAYADFFSTDLHRNGASETTPNNVCLFEFTADYLLSRHTAQYSVTASRNTFLTLRFVSTVGNYDYTIDYNFYLDGTIEVKVRASGFIFAAFYPNHPNHTKNEYGHRIHDSLSSSMHDHVINFRADLDVAGTANSMVRVAVEPTTRSYAWDAPEVPERHTMHLVEHAVEAEAGLDWPHNSREFFIVYSSDQTNAWGQRKGYRVVSGTGLGNTPHLAVENSTALGGSARWAEHDVWVVRARDSEPRGADPLNYIDAGDPLIDFGRIADGEALGPDDDLVLYVNVGSHHVPHSGDVPNTLMHTAASGVMFIPHNFVDRDPSRESVQGVRLQLQGTRSGGFAGFEPDVDEGDGDGELRARNAGHKKDDPEYKMHKGANYFGTPYGKAVTLPLEAIEPDIEKAYLTKEVRVSDLTFNGSAAGLWLREP